MSGDGSLLTHTCFLEKVLNLSQKIVSSPKHPSYPSPVTIDMISDRFDGFDDYKHDSYDMFNRIELMWIVSA